MRILMLGWEFPPFISGGLGTACYGLTRALDRAGHRVTFVLPRAVEPGFTSHVDLLSPSSPEQPEAGAGDGMTPKDAPRPPAKRAVRVDGVERELSWEEVRRRAFERVEFVGVPSAIVSPYSTEAPKPGEVLLADGRRVISISALERLRKQGKTIDGAYEVVEDDELMALSEALDGDLGDLAAGGSGGGSPSAGADYSGDVMSHARRYARLVVDLCRDREFDVIHAHDWMTYPAGMALARLTGKPLVAHIHSTEFDRSGEHVNQAVYDIERRGMHAAVRVCAVSLLTKRIVTERYSVDESKVKVIYNGIDEERFSKIEQPTVRAKDKIVLFMGRITMQKGPEYFVRAAKRVLEKVPDVKFVIAGNGDLYRAMIEQAAALEIGHKVLFTGFLRGRDVTRVFQMADCFVMPSVSEPFGIVPLEAMIQDTPVIISKQSGVSEVVTHALKVDFWDVDEIANKIVAVLRHAPLSDTLKKHGRLELRTLTWEGAAEKCIKYYREAIDALASRPDSELLPMLPIARAETSGRG